MPINLKTLTLTGFLSMVFLYKNANGSQHGQKNKRASNKDHNNNNHNNHHCNNNKECYYEVDGVQIDPSDIQLLKQQINPLCKRWNDKKCVQCSYRSWMNSNGICEQIDPNCKTFNNNSGKCQTCYRGYRVLDGRCVLGQDQPYNVPKSQIYKYNDPFCSKWQKGVCVRCSPDSYFDKNGFCKQIDPNCKSFNKESKKCQQCYSGYQVNYQSGSCQISNQIYNDPYCAKYDQNTKKCVWCATNCYFDKNGRCQPIDPYCKAFKDGQGCIECYGGYILKQGKCIVGNYDYSRLKKVCNNGSCKSQSCENGSCQDCLCGQCQKCLNRKPKKNQKGCQYGTCENSSFKQDASSAKIEIKRQVRQEKRQVKQQKKQSKVEKKEQIFMRNSNQVDKYCLSFKNGKCLQCFPGFTFNQKGFCICKTQKVDQKWYQTE